MPVAHVLVNLERSASWRAQTDTFLRSRGITVCGNDFTTTNVNIVRNLFAPPTPSNPSPRPVFVVINCVSNSPSHAYRELLVNEIYPGGGAQDFGPNIAKWRQVINSVQAPPPTISGPRLNNGIVEFTVPAQRGRTNRVESTANFREWTTVTNLFGVNGPITIREPDTAKNSERFYRVVRP
ncbi:MAG: hypothetical protein L0Z50_00880 [Verrucomicrobiales bacterium]|nr:hypothetical protein [Verrucomicrobiales bacterium]